MYFSVFVIDGWQYFSVIRFFAALLLCCRTWHGSVSLLSVGYAQISSHSGLPQLQAALQESDGVGAAGDPYALEKSDSQQPSSHVVGRVKDNTQHRVPKVLSAVWRFSIQEGVK